MVVGGVSVYGLTVDLIALVVGMVIFVIIAARLYPRVAM
jgi:ABC-type glucose/galactose transport system permease subunit